ncbi:hypothetical protein LguiB_036409 [Lonicera macranthoides]
MAAKNCSLLPSFELNRISRIDDEMMKSMGMSHGLLNHFRRRELKKGIRHIVQISQIE